MPDHLWESHLRHELRYREKGRSRRFRIDRVLDQGGEGLRTKQAFLDIGCGSGTALPWLTEGFECGIGVDISLVDLLVGKKFYEDNGIEHIGLVCAFAEQLPFRDEAFDLINATDVIEHVIDGQEMFLRQMCRVLKAGGFGYFNSPNRFNLFGPEPHVQVWLVGFLPRKYMDAYVQTVRGVRYTSVRLLSYRELSKMLKKVCDGSFRITGPVFDPTVPATTLKARVVKTCPLALSVVNRFLFYFTTDYQVIIGKPPRVEHAQELP
jgi:ubiquinone/menaquinone biosynthesis C-methylase UbiE